MSLYAALVRPLLFRLDPEAAHEAAAAALALAGSLPGAKALLAATFAHRDPALETNVWGLRFPNPVGLAAGFDKDALLLEALPALGFGFVEVGTVTLAPQPGNPRPRLRLPEAEALINHMGFNAGSGRWPRGSRPWAGSRSGGVNLGLQDADPNRPPSSTPDLRALAPRRLLRRQRQLAQHRRLRASGQAQARHILDAAARQRRQARPGEAGAGPGWRPRGAGPFRRRAPRGHLD